MSDRGRDWGMVTSQHRDHVLHDRTRQGERRYHCVFGSAVVFGPLRFKQSYAHGMGDCNAGRGDAMNPKGRP